MLEELRLFKELRAENLGVSDLDIIEIIEIELETDCVELREAVYLGVDILNGHGNGRIDARFREAVMVARNQKEKDRVHNACVSLAKGKPSDHVSSFRTVGSPHVLAKVKAWHEESERLAQANAAKNGGNQSYAG